PRASWVAESPTITGWCMVIMNVRYGDGRPRWNRGVGSLDSYPTVDATASGRRLGACRNTSPPAAVAGPSSIPISCRITDQIPNIVIDIRYQRRYHCGMAMTLRLSDDEAQALRKRADLEGRSMQTVMRQALREYIDRTSRAELLDTVLDEGLPRYAEALDRLGQ